MQEGLPFVGRASEQRVYEFMRGNGGPANQPLPIANGPAQGGIGSNCSPNDQPSFQCLLPEKSSKRQAPIQWATMCFTASGPDSPSGGSHFSYSDIKNLNDALGIRKSRFAFSFLFRLPRA